MRTLLTLALAACAVAPAAAQTVYYQQGRTTYVPNVTYGRQGVYSTPYYVQSRPTVIVSGRRAYSYTPATYSQPSYTYSYSQPTYQTVTYPRTYSYGVQAPITTPQVVYSSPTYYSTPQVVYSTPSRTIYTTPSYSTPTVVYSSPSTIYSTPSYTTPVYSTPWTYSTSGTAIYSQPMTWSQPVMSYSSDPTVAYGQPFRSMSYPSTLNQYGWSQPQYSYNTYGTTSSWSQPYYGSAPVYYSQPQMAQNVVSPFQTQPTLNFVPSGGYDQRLMQVPSGTRSFAGRRANNYYR